jgi:hypothetical protein
MRYLSRLPGGSGGLPDRWYRQETSHSAACVGAGVGAALVQGKKGGGCAEGYVGA